MRQLILFFLVVLLSPAGTQSQNAQQNGWFKLNGRVTDKDTGVVIFEYFNNLNKHHSDTAVLTNGTFTFSGTVNAACEALLWTDTSNHAFDNPYMMRLILEPGVISIEYAAGSLQHAVITGAAAQNEKLEWEKTEATLLLQKTQFRNQYQMAKYDSVSALIRSLDLAYIKKHPASYFSGNLLSKHKRRLPVDTLQIYFGILEGNVKNSNFGLDVLRYVYPLTNDSVFRNKYPAFGTGYNEQLKTIKSIHEISVPDTSGKMISLGLFKGRYILLDFWASWCGPCIQDLPYFEKLIKKYASYPIQFISVSLDTDTAKWKAAVKQHQPSALQLGDMRAFYGMLPVFCKVITGVPQYVLIDKEGYIIDNDLPQPDNKELQVLLDNLFMKKD